MLDGLVEPLAQTEQDRGDVLAGGRQKLVIIARFVKRLPKELLGGT